MSVGVLRQIIEDRVGHAPLRPTLLKIHEACNGNPFYALEVARELGEATDLSASAIHVPGDVRRLVARRIRRLPVETREALLIASALADPSSALVAEEALDPALDAEIVAPAGHGRVEFTHPLFAAAIYESASPERRRAVHKQLAGRVDDPEERARHLALAADRPSERMARSLEAGAAHARSRGAWASAADLLERARDLTPAGRRDEALRRTIAAAEHHIYAGDRPRGRGLLEAVLAEVERGPACCEALRLLAQIKASEESFLEAASLLEEALEHTGEPSQAASVEIGLAFVRANLLEYDEAARLSERARERAEAIGDEALLGEALAFCAMMHYLAGRGVSWERVERSLALEDPDRLVPLMTRPTAIAGFLLLYVGRLPEARERLVAVRAMAIDRGDESDLAFVLWWLVWLETLSGNYAAAAGFADEAALSAAMTGSESAPAWILAQRALLRAHVGDVAGARSDCDAADAIAARTRWTTSTIWIVAARCLLELSVGDAEATWRAAEPLARAIETEGIGEPVAALFLPDALEALIALGQLERAEALLDEFETRARALDRVWALASGRRCRGLLLAARGDLAAAEATLREALAENARVDIPFELGRTLLCLGMVQRRRRERRVARETLTRAVEIFERLGAALWAERARAELSRIGVRRAPTELTASEQTVAELASQGLRNREIAATLFMSERTVEANLARVYRKLGIGSRAELGAKMAARQ